MTAHPAIREALKGFEPTPEQWEAVEHPPTPLSLVAGAGSGKTAVMAARIAHVVVSGVATPAQVLGLTFTNKAAQELKGRVERALAQISFPGEEPSVFTYHGFADRVIRDYGPKIGIEPEVALMSKAQSYLLIGRLLEEMDFEELKVTWVPSVIADVSALSDACANHLVTPEEVVEADQRLRSSYEREGKPIPSRLAQALSYRPEIARAVRAYIDRKRELGRIDYGDQIAIACRLVTERSEVAAALRARWPVVLLDEYQDTNIAQQRMMRAIYPAGSAITVVGDPDQAIYAWRGASLYNILWFPEHFPRAAGERADAKRLQVSFRSAARILAAADAIVGRIPGERRGGDKVLHHHPPTGEGEVTCDLYASEADEAEAMAAEIDAMTAPEGSRDGPPIPYREIAILCRQRRRFPTLQQALRARGVPVEVVGLGGLLAAPEVVDLLAHLRFAARPWDNIAFARIAMGPRWRIDYHDMATLARWAAVHTSRFREALEAGDERGGEIDPGEERFSLADAIGRIDEVTDLSEEAVGRLRGLHAHAEAMRAAIKGCTLAEAVERVLEASGIEDELAVAATPVANNARANLSSFLDEANSFSPLEGETSVAAFLDYLDSARAVEDLEMAQPQVEDSVKLMTMHQAKGLEFDVVFVPGMAKQMFPSVRVSDNPTTSKSELPFAVREDAEFLPRFENNMDRFHKQLRERQMEEERRLAYVALTRARKVLRLSAAHWYERTRVTPAGPGEFFTELAGSPASDSEEERRPHPAVTVRTYAAAPESNPIQADLAARASAWPPSADEGADALFPRGWRRAVEEAPADPASIDRLAAAAGVDESELEEARAEAGRQLQLVSAPVAAEARDERLRSLSVSAMVQLARCPKQFYWTVVRPLPRRPSAAARLGQEIHRWIEIRSIGQGRLDDPEQLPDLTSEELGDEPAEGRAARRSDEALKATFEASPYSSLRPRAVEQAFVIALEGGYLVRGRMDAVYIHDDGTWEVVDYKTGGAPEPSDPTSRLQLAIYALAARRIWGVAPEHLRVSYLYLQSGATLTTAATELDYGEADLVAAFRRIEVGDFDPVPGPLCRSCDFLRFCAAGRAHVEGRAEQLV